MLSSIGSVIWLMKKLCSLAPVPPPWYWYINSLHHCNHLLHSIPMNIILPYHMSLDPFPH
jgi:hypothetical protein